jgi:hypothetical protein
MENQSSIKNLSFSMAFDKTVHPNRRRVTLQEYGAGWDLFLVWWVGLLEACTARVQISQVRLGVGEGGSHSFYMLDRNVGRKSLVSRGDGSAQA